VEAPDLFRAWFYELQLTELDRGMLVIEASNESQCRFLQRSCLPALTRAAQAATERLVGVECRVRAAPVAAPAEPLPSKRRTFDTFVVGPENKIAHGAAVVVSQSPGAYNPLLIVGPPGTGKTHLLRAMETSVNSCRAGARVVYWPSLSLAAEVVKCLETGMPEVIREDLSSLDVLLIDDVDELAGKERTLEELFHVYQSMVRAERQVVFTSRVPVDQLLGLGERLTTRLASGLVVTLEPPSFETRCMILTRWAQTEGAEIPEDLTHTLARSFDASIAELITAAQRLISLSQSRGLPLDVALAAEAHGLNPASTPIGAVLQAVSARFDAPRERLATQRPGRKWAMPRDAAVYLSQKLTGLGIDEIGASFGGLTPAQIVEISRRIERERGSDRALSEMLDEIAREAKNAF
jgi:chromosomal replication initiator protein